MSKDLSGLEEILGVKFKNLDILNESITHRSYLNENLDWRCPNNERLEFLGDAVLELIVTELLFAKYPQYNEGRMTSIRAALVNYQNLADVSKKIGLENFILMSKGELQDVGKARDVILANAFEAVLGALYLDAGFNGAKNL
jgi:ribonuclease-3